MPVSALVMPPTVCFVRVLEQPVVGMNVSHTCIAGTRIFVMGGRKTYCSSASRVVVVCLYSFYPEAKRQCLMPMPVHHMQFPEQDTFAAPMKERRALLPSSAANAGGPFPALKPLAPATGVSSNRSEPAQPPSQSKPGSLASAMRLNTGYGSENNEDAGHAPRPSSALGPRKVSTEANAAPAAATGTAAAAGHPGLPSARKQKGGLARVAALREAEKAPVTVVWGRGVCAQGSVLTRCPWSTRKLSEKIDI